MVQIGFNLVYGLRTATTCENPDCGKQSPHLGSCAVLKLHGPGRLPGHLEKPFSTCAECRCTAYCT